MSGRLIDVILRGTRAAQPAATATPPGSLYYVTDESVTERVSDAGTAWESYTDTGGAGSGTVTNTGTLTADLPVVGNGGVDVKILAAGTALQVLRMNAGATAVEFATIAGTGDVVGPASATDNAITRFDSTTGKLIQNSTVTVSDTGDINAGTTAVLTTGTVELGAAADTTLSRASAGVLAVEGVNVLTTATGQPLDATLTALAAYNTNGLITQTAADTFTGRTVTGTANQITVTNGDGVAGNPTLSLPADVLIPTVLTVPNTGLHLLDTNASHDLIVKPGSDLTLDRTLTVTTGDADRTLTLTGDASITGTNTGDQTITLTSDVTGSGTGSFATTIANDAVTFAKMQNIATDRLIGRDTAATGDPEEISVGGGLEFTGTAGIQRSALTGDVTATAGSNSTTIANDAVTFAKMQNIATDRLLGRDTAASGDVEEIALSTGLEFSGSASIQLTTAARTKAIGITIDGGGSAITTGVKGDLYVPFACTITAVTMLADQSGSIVVDIWKDAYANYPPTVADTITAAAKPTITTAVKSQDTTLTGWTTSISADDTLRFNVDSATTIQRVHLMLTVTV